MVTFLICLALLITAFFAYGAFLDKVIKIDSKADVPSKSLYDGVDYVPIARWKSFLIQLLNIAGIGPIFGAILGASFGPVAFLWITLGGIFMGAVHDYLSGVIIVRNNGLSFPEITGKYLGNGVRVFMRVFSLILLILVGVVFLRSPASIMLQMCDFIPYMGWIAIIFAYYFIATCLPIDKIITKLYPLFGAALIIMALCLLYVILCENYPIPELTLENFHADKASNPIFPVLFITIACGAISGFHATQSPIIARCVKNERECRFVFFESMIAESIIALIWAAGAMCFFGDGGLTQALTENGNDASKIVGIIAKSTLGVFGSILAILGVVAAPITSGDTAFRSARLIIADFLHINQKKIRNRLAISIPIFAIGLVLVFVDFGIIWRYFSWTNQALAAIVLWTIVMYLHRHRMIVAVAFVPAVFMTMVCASFVFVSNQFFGLGAQPLSYILGGIVTAVITGLMTYMLYKDRTK